MTMLDWAQPRKLILVTFFHGYLSASYMKIHRVPSSRLKEGLAKPAILDLVAPTDLK